METIWIEPRQLEKALSRNESYWHRELEEYPLLWIMAPTDRLPCPIPAPAGDIGPWLDVDYVTEAAEYRLSHTCFVADALPVHMPWLGPNQFAAWLGAELRFMPREHNTTWVEPFFDDWAEHPDLRINPENKWWKIYLEQMQRSVEAGRNKWVTAYPDLHSGIDALSAIRGTERLSMDLLLNPEPIHRAMRQMTELFKFVVNKASEIVLPTGQGTSNWLRGWSAERVMCIGHNDFSCMISPEMFREFIREDILETINHVDHSIYHLDGPGALQHLPELLAIKRLDAIQWVPGAGYQEIGSWIKVMRRIQDADKAVTLRSASRPLNPEEALLCCRELDPASLFLWVEADSPQEAHDLFTQIRRICAGRRNVQIAKSF